MRSSFLLVAVAVASLARSARADEERPEPVHLPTPWMSFDALVRRETLPELDSLLGEGVTIRPKGATWPSPGPVLLAGGGWGFGATWGHWVLPLLRVDFATAIGPSPRVVTALDGSVAELRPWTTRYVSASLFGVGVRTIHRRWMFAAIVAPGVAIAWMDASIASGRDATELHAAAVSPSLRGTLEACRRLDPATRACLAFEPSLYEFGFLSGGALALRWEIGP